MTPKGRKPLPQLYTPKETAVWEAHVAEVARAQLLGVEVEGEDFVLPVDEVRVLANLRFNLDKPVSYPKRVVHATKKPDLDNLVKAVLDGLVQGRVLADDNCITDMMVSKRYSHPLEHPTGVEIELTCLKL
jgi:Holliday junction resolvase RusA-like endonuclease